MTDFPANNQRARKAFSSEDEAPKVAERAKLEKVIEGEVIRRKKPIGKRIKTALIGGDGRSVWEQMMDDVILPNMRDLIVDVIQGGAERMVYGESRHAHRRPGLRGKIVNYQGFANSVPVKPNARDDPRVSLSRKARATHNFEEILIPSRSEAEAVLEGLFAYLEQYEQVSVAELYEMVGISSNYAEVRYGWTDLRGSRVERARNGYFLLDLPQPELLER